MKFYLYEDFDYQIGIKWDYDRFFFKRWVDSTYECLLTHKDRTSNPANAKYFIVLSTLKITSFTGFSIDVLKNYILNLPHLNKGLHIVFDMSDRMVPLFTNLHKNIVHFKSAFGLSTYRPLIDVNLPLFQRYYLNYNIPLINQRPIVASFRGAPRLNSCQIRKTLLELNDNDKFVYLESGGFEFDIVKNKMIIKRDNNDSHSYVNLLYNSIFSICVRGCGLHSYRLGEALNAGSIPVIISDDYPLPFNDVINWDDICIIIKEKDIVDLNKILMDKIKNPENLEKLQQMQNNIKNIYNKYFCSIEKLIENSLIIFENKIKLD